LKIWDLDLSFRVVRPERVTSTKHSYCLFFSEKLKEYLTNVYLPYREGFIKRRGRPFATCLKT